VADPTGVRRWDRGPASEILEGVREEGKGKVVSKRDLEGELGSLRSGFGRGGWGG
jgi:hypothetical protein